MALHQDLVIVVYLLILLLVNLLFCKVILACVSLRKVGRFIDFFDLSEVFVAGMQLLDHSLLINFKF